ncbi:ABC-F family ATP-binding cassette domain-containing protein [Chloroflexi bacterium TSY]|nr:ABC-F family ATP-binding cassette domain-containing protein [Chloroflexi bacterium TSY]
MAIISLRNIGQSYGDFDVFLGVTASIPNDGKVGLVGPNGIGKTTLLRILAGLDSSSTGSVHLARSAQIGYLCQEAMEAFAGRENTVYAEMLTVFRELQMQEEELRQMEEQMASGHASDEMMTAYSKKQEAFEMAGGYDYDQRISQVLVGLGFKRDDWETPLSHLSGGQKTRALLARLLLERPDLLILDEPTNHLDVEAIEWLENTLRTWEGALLIVSHDRYFLDKVVNRIWEMSRDGVEEYRGNYSAYVVQRQERWEQRQAQFDSVVEGFLNELDYIKRNIARDSTRDQAVGRMRRLVRQVKAAQIGGIQLLINNKWSVVTDQIVIPQTRWNVMELEQNIKALPRPTNRPRQLNLRLDSHLRSGELVLRTSELEIGYPGTSLFTAEPITLHRKECAALIGPNGSGKTTFLRTLMEQLEPLAGELRLGASLKIGYFAQAHDSLEPEKTVLDTLLDHKFMDLGPARSHLAQYLFRGEDVFKQVSTLSGGERGRLALALLALDGANFLLLDEPTNHLDIPAQEVLQTVIEKFDGTTLLVSHDRYLIDRLATQIWDLHDRRLHVFHGNYSDFVVARQQMEEARKAEAAANRASSQQGRRTDRTQQYAERRRAKAIEEMETTIQQFEGELETLGQELQSASDAQNLEKIQQIGKEYATTEQQLEQAMEEWEELAE